MQEYEATDPCPSDDPADRASYGYSGGITHSAGISSASCRTGRNKEILISCLPTLSISRNQDPDVLKQRFNVLLLSAIPLAPLADAQ